MPLASTCLPVRLQGPNEKVPRGLGKGSSAGQMGAPGLGGR